MGAPTMGFRYASGELTTTIAGGRPVRCVNALSVVYSRISRVLDVVGDSAGAAAWAEIAAKVEQRTASRSRFMMVWLTGKFRGHDYAADGRNVEPGKQYNYSAT